MEFLVLAYDGTDKDAKQRRLKARPAHIQSAKKLKELGNFIEGGAILDKNAEMIGSTLYMSFPSCKEFDDWLANDPYTIHGVWVDTKVEQIKLVK